MKKIKQYPGCEAALEEEATITDLLRLSEWPTDELENLSACPVCGSEDRTLKREMPVDNIFCCAPGKWTSWRCSECGCSYLDPRPSAESIYLAYDTYYTHQTASSKANYPTLSTLRRFRRRLVNSYTKWRVSSPDEPASCLGILVLLAMPAQRNRLDREFRYLPYRSGIGKKLLDVGCGDGSFVRTSLSCSTDSSYVQTPFARMIFDRRNKL